MEHTAKWCCNIRSNHTAKGIKTNKRIDRYLAISKSNSEIGVRAGEGTMLGRKKLAFDRRGRFLGVYLQYRGGRGGSARLPPMWPGFDVSAVPYAGWVRCWFSPYPEVSRFPGFRLSAKLNISKFQFYQERRPHEKPLRRMWLPLEILKFISYLFICLFGKELGRWKLLPNSDTVDLLWSRGGSVGGLCSNAAPSWEVKIWLRKVLGKGKIFCQFDFFFLTYHTRLLKVT